MRRGVGIRLLQVSSFDGSYDQELQVTRALSHSAIQNQEEAQSNHPRAVRV